MEITDLEGRVIAIADLDASIKMVEEYMTYTHVDADDSLKRLEQRRLAYWTDIHQKLTFLKANQIINND
jgi:hypothetical protein